MLKAAKGGVKVVFLLSSYIYIVESVRKKKLDLHHQTGLLQLSDQLLTFITSSFLAHFRWNRRRYTYILCL